MQIGQLSILIGGSRKFGKSPLRHSGGAIEWRSLSSVTRFSDSSAKISLRTLAPSTDAPNLPESVVSFAKMVEVAQRIELVSRPRVIFVLGHGIFLVIARRSLEDQGPTGGGRAALYCQCKLNLLG
jgi:hypothetical protein